MSVLRKTLLWVVLAGCPIAGQAFTQGEGEPEGGSPHQYDIELSSLDVSKNHVGGRTEPFPWNLGGWYVVNFYCEQADISRAPIYYTTTTTMPPSNQGANRFRLNEYLDVEVQVWVAGGYKKYVQAPFTNVSNRNSNNSCKKRKGYTRATNVESGSKGKVTFIVTKPIINGINITSQSLVEVAGRMGSAGPTPTTAISRVVIKSGLITVPDKCTFNRETKSGIEFGDLPGSAARLNGTNYSKSVPIHVVCEGWEFRSGRAEH